MFFQMEKAKLTILKKNAPALDVMCSFNPSEYTVTNSITYSESNIIGGKSKLDVISAGSRELKLVLYFDTMGEQGIASRLLRISDFLSPGDTAPVTAITGKIAAAANVGKKGEVAQHVIFSWGNFSFQGLITSYSETFTMFSRSGKPTRSKVNLTIKESKNKEGLLDSLTSQGFAKSLTVMQGDSLWSIAAKECGDCSKWKAIAKANNIVDPLKLIPGQVLKIPFL